VCSSDLDIFYPLTSFPKLVALLLKQSVSLKRWMGWFLFVHIYLAGIFMYFAARQFKLGKVPSLFSAAAYMFAGYLVSMVAPGHDGKIYVTAFFPLLMLFLDRGFERRPFFNFSILGALIGLITLTPHIAMIYFSLWALSLYAAYRLVFLFIDEMTLRKVIKPALWMVYAVMLGVGMSFIQMYPGVTYTQNFSPRADSKRGWDWATSWSMHSEEAASLVIPEFSGVNSQQPVGSYYWGKNAFKDNSEWLGTVALFLAMLGVAAYRKRRLAWFFFGLTLFAFAYALGANTPLFHLFIQIPKVESIRAPAMAMFIASFSVALLAGMALQEIVERRRERSEINSAAYKYIFFGFPALLLFLALGFSLAGRGMIDLWTSIFYSDAGSRMVQQGTSVLDVAYFNLPSITKGAWFAFFVVGIAALFIWTYSRGKMGQGALLAVVALAVVDGVRFDSRFISLVDNREYAARFEPNAMTEFLQNEPGEFRVLPLARPNDATLAYFGINAVVGYHGNQLRWYDALLGGPALSNVYNARLLNLVGARYLINQTEQELPANYFGDKPLVPVASFGQQRIIRNDNAYPRVFLVNEFEVIPDREKINHEILEGGGDLRRLVYLEKEPGITIAPPDTIATDSLPGDSAWVIDYQSDSVLVGLNVSRHSLLVLTDCWYDAWQATIDGRPAEILQADAAFRAVAVPAGSRQVLFKYHSGRYALGKTVTYASSAYLILVIGFLWYRGRRAEAVEPDSEEKS